MPMYRIMQHPLPSAMPRPRYQWSPRNHARNLRRALSSSCSKFYLNPNRHKPAKKCFAQVPVDAPPEWTLDQIAGMVFAGVMVASYYLSGYLDQYVAASQRMSMGLCVKCGGLEAGGCDKCRVVTPEEGKPTNADLPQSNNS